MKRRNIVGPKISRSRDHQKLTQSDLVARCGVLGWHLSRGTLAKIEAQIRCVTDAELLILALALKIDIEELYPTNLALVTAQLNQASL